LRKGGLAPGDSLIATKPIGTGTILAAHMRGKAKARWTFAALDHMIKSNRVGAEIVAAHGASGATDITGFGLLGHLVEMTRASEVDATLYLSEIPMLDGARECVAAGIFSSLQPQNVRLRRAIRDVEVAAALPDYPLLFDPQTAGGILASIPAGRADACITALRAAGYERSAIIGIVEPRSEHLEPISIARSRPAGRLKADNQKSLGRKQDEPVY
jgi:selenide,water dikinase